MKRYSPAEAWALGKTVITAHSGCEETAPNSIEHIKAAIASGAEMIEFDVRNIGGVLLLSHDEPEDTTACPTLREAFALVAPAENLHMNIDVKTEGLIEGVMALAKELFSQVSVTATARSPFPWAAICGAVCGPGRRSPKV